MYNELCYTHWISWIVNPTSSALPCNPYRKTQRKEIVSLIKGTNSVSVPRFSSFNTKTVNQKWNKAFDMSRYWMQCCFFVIIRSFPRICAQKKTWKKTQLHIVDPQISGFNDSKERACILLFRHLRFHQALPTTLAKTKLLIVPDTVIYGLEESHIKRKQHFSHFSWLSYWEVPLYPIIFLTLSVPFFCIW